MKSLKLLVKQSKSGLYIYEMTYQNVVIFKIEYESIETPLIWLQERANNFWGDEIPSFIQYKNSIVESIDDFYNDIPDESENELQEQEYEEKIEILYNYRLNHSFKFCFKGLDLIECYLGKNPMNELEISWCNEVGKYHFINIDEFIIVNLVNGKETTI